MYETVATLKKPLGYQIVWTRTDEFSAKSVGWVLIANKIMVPSWEFFFGDAIMVTSNPINYDHRELVDVYKAGYGQVVGVSLSGQMILDRMYERMQRLIVERNVVEYSNRKVEL